VCQTLAVAGHFAAQLHQLRAGEISADFGLLARWGLLDVSFDFQNKREVIGYFDVRHREALDFYVWAYKDII
jgi:hypothetical protein